MNPTINTFPYAQSIMPFFALAQSERVAVVGSGNSNQIHGGDGWDHGFQYALAKRYGLFGSGLISVAENGGNGSGQGYFYSGGGMNSSSISGAPSQLAAYMANAPAPANYGYASTSPSTVGRPSLAVTTVNNATSNLVPAMTANSSGGFTASASSEVWGAAYLAFDQNDTTEFATSLVALPQWLQIQAPAAQTVIQYSFFGSSAFGGGQSPAAWTLQGSNNGSAWTTVDSRTGQSIPTSTLVTYTVASPGSYSYYRLNVTANRDGSSGFFLRSFSLLAQGNGNLASPWDARDGFKGTLHYGTFPTGTAAFTPAFTRSGPNGYIFDSVYDVAGVSTPTNAGGYGMARVSVTIPANSARTGDGSFLFSGFSNGQGDGTGSGSFFFTYLQFEQVARTSGMSYGTLAFYGGAPLRTQSQALQNAGDATLTHYLTETRRPLGASKAVLIVVNEAQNSRNDTATLSVGPAPALGNTTDGFADNCQAIINRINSIYQINGWSTASLYFLFIGDHNITGNIDDDAQVESYRATLTSKVCPLNPRTAAVNLNQLVNGPEMLANFYYATNVTDQPHLNASGYERLALKIIDGFSPVGAGSSATNALTSSDIALLLSAFNANATQVTQQANAAVAASNSNLVYNIVNSGVYGNAVIAAILAAGVSLTVAERNTLAGVIDSRLLDAGDATDLIAGIVARIGNTNVDQAALVVAIKAALFAAGSTGNKLVVDGVGRVTSGSLLGYVAPDNATLAGIAAGTTVINANVKQVNGDPLTAGRLAELADEFGNSGALPAALSDFDKTGIATAVAELPIILQIGQDAAAAGNMTPENGDGDITVTLDAILGAGYAVRNTDNSYADNVAFRAYPWAAYQVGSLPPRPPTTYTNSVGQWIRPLNLDAGEWAIVAANPSTGQANTLHILVSSDGTVTVLT